MCNYQVKLRQRMIVKLVVFVYIRLAAKGIPSLNVHVSL